MSADLLRRAASLMRERAEAARTYSDAATSQPLAWASGADGQVYGLGGDFIAATDGPPVAHIASWHPAVALAVADWLDGVALFVEAKEDEEYFDLDGDPIAAEDTHAIGSALVVARAYLGESA